jgi:hypothetical protein
MPKRRNVQLMKNDPHQFAATLFPSLRPGIKTDKSVMRKNFTAQSGFFTPRLVGAFALFSLGIFLGMLSLSATPSVETKRAAASVLAGPQSFASAFDHAANGLSSGTVLPRGPQFSVTPPAGPLTNRPAPLLPEVAVNSPGNPVLVGRQSAPSTTEGSGSSPNTASQSQWTVVNPPQPKGTMTDNGLNGVTCVSASDCWAVGAFKGNAYQTLIEHWDGVSWQMVNSPNTDTSKDNILYSVACRSASDCWAVGGFIVNNSVYTLTEHWDGNSWTIVSSPNPDGTFYDVLASVTCSPAQCLAAGFSYAGVQQTLIERWDGTSWTIVSSPNTDPAQHNVLFGVSCSSASDCWTVGVFVTATAVETLTEHWDGTSWAIVSSPNVTGSESTLLLSVTCASASECWAVGYHEVVERQVGPGGAVLTDQNVIERWDGSSWTIASSATVALEDNALASVTCASASDCWAVGLAQSKTSFATKRARHALIEHWNGIAWAEIPSVNAGTTPENALVGVTCVPAAADCWAVGYYFQGSFNIGTLTERWNGSSWTSTPSPNRPPTEAYNSLNDVTCVSASDCWAVGSYVGDDLRNRTVIEHWNGAAWSLVSSPNTSATEDNFLLSVTCASSSECWAVGAYRSANNSQLQTLAVRWDGTAWSIVNSPDANTNNDNVLNSVTCVSASDCWAVGYAYNDNSITVTGGNAAETLIEHWNGTSWSIFTSPNTSTTESNFLSGVTCVSAADCWAVGQYVSTSGPNQTLTEHWNGTAWAVVASPNVEGGDRDFLYAVSCVSSTDCWAAGSYYTAANLQQTLIERWNGTTWSVVNSPNVSSAGPNYLNDLVCVSGSECWAAGIYFNTVTGNDQTLVQHWDGTSWAIINSANTTPTDPNGLYGIACASASECWAVGYYHNGRTWQALAEHYVATLAPIPTSVVSRKTHGAAGTFDLDLPLTGTPGIECRSGLTPGDHQIIATFANPITLTGASISSGTGSVSSYTTDGATVTINLTGIANAQNITIILASVSDGSNSGDVSIPMSILLGDVNGNGVVSNTDVAALKSQVAAPVTSSNFRNDVNANGVISNSDVSTSKAQVGTSLP